MTLPSTPGKINVIAQDLLDILGDKMLNQLLVECSSCPFVGTFALLILLGQTPPPHRIAEEGYDKLRLGMTSKEVEEILGVPPGDYGPGKGEIVNYGDFSITSAMIRTDPSGKKWLAGSFAITVCFSKEGKVWGLGTHEVYRRYESVTDLLLQKIALKEAKPYPPGSLNQLMMNIRRFKRD